MTLANQDSFIHYDIETPIQGATLGIPFPRIDINDVEVSYRSLYLDSDGDTIQETIILDPSTYTVSNSGVVINDISILENYDGRITISRRTPIEQTDNYVDQLNFPGANFEISLDKIYKIAQENRDRGLSNLELIHGIYENENFRGPQGIQGIQGFQGRYRIRVYLRLGHGDPQPNTPSAIGFDIASQSLAGLSVGWSEIFPIFNAQLHDVWISFVEYNPSDNSISEFATPFKTDADLGPTGPAGAQGQMGFPGWSPIFEIVEDSDRRVMRVSDWTNPDPLATNKPVVGSYVGVAGLVNDIAQAIDLRGPSGADGSDGTDGTDGTDAVVTFDGDGAIYTVLYEAGNTVRNSTSSSVLDWGPARVILIKLLCQNLSTTLMKLKLFKEHLRQTQRPF